MSTSPDLVHLFTGIASAVLLSRIAGRIAVRLRQPPVVGEIAAGVLMGPTVLHGAVGAFLFPVDIRPVLSAVANIGLALFMFGVGLHLRPADLSGQLRTAGIVAVGATAPVFLLGTGLALLLTSGSPGGASAATVVFLGLALSITALPVLARILVDRGLTATREGTVAMASAAVVDVLAWVALAALAALVSDGRAVVLLFVPYLLLMLVVVRPLLARTARRPGPPVLIVGALLSAAATEAMGMHLIFGALLFGLVVPRGHENSAGGTGTSAAPAAPAPSALGRLRESAEQTSALLMPAFFVLSGLSVDLGGLDGRGLAELALIMVVAVAGKTGGTYAAARIGRLPARSAAVLAALMNTRGLTELVVLSVGLQLSLIDQDLYSIMVVMALVTTAMTGPLLTLLDRRAPAGPPVPDDRGDTRRVLPLAHDQGVPS
ncbi:cation:proton antiporter [Streptomyces sp. NPDC006134]|uniref:cation:proton antiporter n=1 Tax=Streptomyces sp. NPDC006134 TaxID=3154467 RepID=UPI0033F0BDEF